MIRPRWVWAFDDATGQAVDAAVSPVFTSQYDAEQWLGEHWRAVAASGAATARLLHDGAQAAPSVPLPGA